MEFKEALKLLYKGEKVRRRDWPKSHYLKKYEDGEIKSYRTETSTFVPHLNMIETKAWKVIGEEDLGEFNFIDLMEFLRQRKKVKLKFWNNDQFIELSNDQKEVYFYTDIQDNFEPTYACYSATDWEVIND